MRLLVSQAHGGLLMKPGFGKTSAALGALSVLRNKGLVKRTLVVAPLRPCYLVWPDEIEKWWEFQHLRWNILHGKDREAKLHYDADVDIINFEGLQWLWDRTTVEPRVGPPSRGKLWKWDHLIVDESTKLKNGTGKRFKALADRLHMFNRRWILTGTVRPNNLMDLWAQIYLLDRGNALGTYYTAYRNRYFFQPNPMDPHVFQQREDAMSEIVDRVAPLVVVKNERDREHSPNPRPVIVPIALEGKLAEDYRQMENEYILRVDEGVVIAGHAAVAGGKLRQICNGAVFVTEGSSEWSVLHDHKLDALEDILVGLAGEPCLVIYEFRHDLARIRARLKKVFGYEPPSATGMSMEKTLELARNFNKGEVPIMLGQPAGMGHGLNLQKACKNLIWFGNTWDFDLSDQTIRRVRRRGQEHEVSVYHITVKGSIEERVAKVLHEKELGQLNLEEEIKKRRKELAL